MPSLDERIAAFLASQGGYTAEPLVHTCEHCGRTFTPKPANVGRFCSTECRDADPINGHPHGAPWVCECDRPAPDGIGECGHCRRLCLTHTFALHGRPDCAVTPEPVEDIVPGTGFWDGRDGRFYFVDANPDPAAALITLTVSGVGLVDYERGVKLLCADDARAAEAWNRRVEGRVA